MRCSSPAVFGPVSTTQQGDVQTGFRDRNTDSAEKTIIVRHRGRVDMRRLAAIRETRACAGPSANRRRAVHGLERIVTVEGNEVHCSGQKQ